MKQSFILILMMLTTNSCKSQDRIDLEQINIASVEVSSLFSDVDKFHKGLDELRWAYPNYLTYDVAKFQWNNVIFINNKDERKNRLEVIMDSVGFHPIVINIQIFQEEPAKNILQHIKKKYGNPVVLHESMPSELDYTAYFWRNVKDGESLIWCISYSNLNGQSTASMDLLVIKNETDIVGQDYDYNDINALEYLVMQYSRWSIEKVRGVLKK